MTTAVQTMELGGLSLTPLLDGYFRLDGGALFGVVPKMLWEKRAPADERPPSRGPPTRCGADSTRAPRSDSHPPGGGAHPAGGAGPPPPAA